MSEEEETRPCVICNESNDQMLMLSCVHDPCINCAAVHYVQNQPPNSRAYKCPLCSLKTDLDSSSVVQLQHIYAKTVKKKAPREDRLKLQRRYDYFQDKIGVNRGVYEAQAVGSKSNAGSRNNHQVPQANYIPQSNYAPVSYNVQPRSTKSSATLTCAEHPQDELSYYCFSCCKLICPECAIHGTHRAHEVQATKRAIRQMKNSVTQYREQLSQRMGKTTKHKEQFKNALKQQSDRHRTNIDHIKGIFTHLHNTLMEQQKNTLKAAEQINQSNCIQIKKKCSELDKTIDDLHELRKQMEALTKKEDMTVMQEYAAIEQEFKQIMQEEDSLVSHISNLQECALEDISDKGQEIKAIAETMRVTSRSL